MSLGGGCRPIGGEYLALTAELSTNQMAGLTDFCQNVLFLCINTAQIRAGQRYVSAPLWSQILVKNNFGSQQWIKRRKMEDTKRNQQMNSQDDTQKYLDCFIYTNIYLLFAFIMLYHIWILCLIFRTPPITKTSLCCLTGGAHIESLGWSSACSEPERACDNNRRRDYCQALELVPKP